MTGVLIRHSCMRFGRGDRVCSVCSARVREFREKQGLDAVIHVRLPLPLVSFIPGSKGLHILRSKRTASESRLAPRVAFPCAFRVLCLACALRMSFTACSRLHLRLALISEDRLKNLV